MLVNILKTVCWIGYFVCGILLISYGVGYLKIKKQLKDNEEDK